MKKLDKISISAGKFRGLLLAQFDTPGWRKLLADPDTLMSLPGARLLKDSPTTRAVVVNAEVDARKHLLHVKQLKKRNWFFTLKYLFQRSRARRLFRRHVALVERGLPTVRPVAAVSERSGPFLKRSYLVTEHLDARPFFELWEKEIYPAGNPPDTRRKIMGSVAKLVARMHESGVFHRDLKSSNILVKTDGEPVIADLDGARIGRRVTYRQRVRDLARLSTSLVPLANMADRHFILKTYLSALGSGDDLKKTGRDIARTGLKILHSKRIKAKYDEHEYRYLDAFAERQRRWLAAFD